MDVTAAGGGSDHENPKAGLPAGRSGWHVPRGLGARAGQGSLGPSSLSEATTHRHGVLISWASTEQCVDRRPAYRPKLKIVLGQSAQEHQRMVRPRSGCPGTMTLREHADPLAVIGRRLPQCGEQSGIVMDPELGPRLLQQRLHAPHALQRLRGIHIEDRHAP